MSGSRICLLLLFVIHLSVFAANAADIYSRNGGLMIASNLIRDDTVAKRPTYQEYLTQRKSLADDERKSCFGSDVQLNANEIRANDVIMRVKAHELREGHINPSTFNPSHHLFEVLDNVKNSELFKILRKMPKGGILHAHDTGLCSANYLVQLTYEPNLWQCDKDNKIVQFLFSPDKPSQRNNCEWNLVSEVRLRAGKENYDTKIRKLFTLFDRDVNPKIQFNDINAVWQRFMGLFGTVGPIVTYAPVWKAYYKQALREMYEDGVQYLEFRGLLPDLYDFNGKVYQKEDIMQIYYDALNEFKEEHPDFIGSKFIYAPIKAVPNNTALEYFNDVRKLHSKFPDFLAGFDLVGQEDTSPKISDFAENLLALPEDIHFFLHAGETNWYGSIDENLIDAVLLGTKRIGHGYALAKHPKVLDLVKERDIAIEVNPVSNQVLKLVDDYRNHPASIFLARNVPLVISSDDPSFWEVTPLTHDFYMAFLGIASAESDLRTLKKFAINSIKYSSLDEPGKVDALLKWEKKWDKFIDDVIQNHGNGSA